MSLPPPDAADALRHIARTQQRSAAAFRYQAAAPHLSAWGAIWIIGYTGIYFFPRAWLLWPALVLIGTGASWQLARRKGSAATGRRVGLTMAVLAGFIAAIFAVLPPQSGNQINALFPLLVAAAYVLAGIWMPAARLALLGAALGALTLAGFFWLPQWFLLWMAVMGGGALILGGLWLRHV